MAKRKTSKSTSRRESKLILMSSATTKLLEREEQAAAIVAQVLVHFGAGYGLQREHDEEPKQNQSKEDLANRPIFRRPDDLAQFFFRLWRSTLKEFDKIDWTDPGFRDTCTNAAFEHGKLARRQSGNARVTFDTILATLRKIQKQYCPIDNVRGGGRVCGFR
jgi:hypothetical protein